MLPQAYRRAGVGLMYISRQPAPDSRKLDSITFLKNQKRQAAQKPAKTTSRNLWVKLFRMFWDG
jgi:hypothetical protein